VRLETPQEQQRRGGSSHARGKRPPEAEVNDIINNNVCENNVFLKRIRVPKLPYKGVTNYVWLAERDEIYP